MVFDEMDMEVGIGYLLVQPLVHHGGIHLAVHAGSSKG
jgi:hypothetical protein